MSIFDQYAAVAGKIGWPAGIPDCFLQTGFSYGPTKSTTDTAMGTGLKKKRRHFSVTPWEMTGSIVVTRAQRKILDAWIKDVLNNGALPFVKVDPIEPATLWQWRLNEPHAYAPWHGDRFIVTFKLIRLPGSGIFTPDPPIVPGDCVGLMDGAGVHLVDAAGACLTS